MNLQQNLNEILEVNSEVKYNALAWKGNFKRVYNKISYETLKKVIEFRKAEGWEIIFNEVN